MIELTSLIFIVLSALGASLIITKSFLFEKIRFAFISKEYLFTLVNCPQCMSFWTGLVFAFIMLPISSIDVMIGSALISSFAGEIIEKTIYEK